MRKSHGVRNGPVPVIILSLCTLFLGQTLTNAQTHTGSEEVQALLTRPGGWTGLFQRPGIVFYMDMFFQIRDEKIIVRIDIPDARMTCEREVTLALGIVRYDGCRESGVALTFDSGDDVWQFKGGTSRGSTVRLKAK